MQNKIRENTTEKTSQLSIKKNENKKKNKSGSDDIHEKLKRKFSNNKSQQEDNVFSSKIN